MAGSRWGLCDCQGRADAGGLPDERGVERAAAPELLVSDEGIGRATTPGLIHLDDLVEIVGVVRDRPAVLRHNLPLHYQLQ